LYMVGKVGEADLLAWCYQIGLSSRARASVLVSAEERNDEHMVFHRLKMSTFHVGHIEKIENALSCDARIA